MSALPPDDSSRDDGDEDVPTSPEQPLASEISSLSTTSTAREINDKIADTASANLDRVAESLLVRQVRTRTKIPLRVIEGQLASYKREFAEPDPKEPPWAGELDRDKQGIVRPTADNVLRALRVAPEWKGVLAINDFSFSPWMLARPPWANGEWRGPVRFSDADEARTAVWLQERGIYVLTHTPLRQALSVALDDQHFHPLKDWLIKVRTEWDGTLRLDTALEVYFGVQPIPNYTDVVFRCWMISAVARVFEPGCIAKYVLVLEGSQDIGKSSALRILGGPYFSDDIAELGTKDSKIGVAGAWLIELAELDSVSRADISAVKAFISRQVEKFRPPYGKIDIERPRQCVFAGSVNPPEDAGGGYLTDTTGGVRFWPVRCGRIDLEALRRDRDQLWAEASLRYEAGEPWYSEAQSVVTTARSEQTARVALGPVDAYLAECYEAGNLPLRHDLVTINRLVDYLTKIKQVRCTVRQVMHFLRGIPAFNLGQVPLVGERPRIWAIRRQRQWSKASTAAIQAAWREIEDDELTDAQRENCLSLT